MTPQLGRLANCEREFANLVQDFIGRIDPVERRHAEYICRSWAAQWAQNMPGTILRAGAGLAEFENACARSFWRTNYYRHRETILAQKAKRRGSRPKELVQCAQCGQEFLQKRVDSRYCSPQCWKAGYRATRSTHACATKHTCPRMFAP